MSDIKPLPCPWCGDESVFGDIGPKVFVECSNVECCAYGPEALLRTDAAKLWNRIASLPDQHARAISILRRIVNGYRPAHGSMEAWDDALALLREVDGGVIADTR